MKKFFYIIGLVSICGLAESAFLELLAQEARTAFRLVHKRSYHVITPGIKPTIPPLPTTFLEQQPEKPFPSKKVHFIDADHTRFVVDKKPIPFVEPPEVKEQDNHSIRVNLEGDDLKKK